MTFAIDVNALFSYFIIIFFKINICGFIYILCCCFLSNFHSFSLHVHFHSIMMLMVVVCQDFRYILFRRKNCSHPKNWKKTEWQYHFHFENSPSSSVRFYSTIKSHFWMSLVSVFPHLCINFIFDPSAEEEDEKKRETNSKAIFCGKAGKAKNESVYLFLYRLDAACMLL